MAPEREKRIDLTDLPLGSHLCLFYETSRDLLDMLVPYFKGGIDNNQSCIWVIPEPETVEEAQKELARHLPGVDRYLADRTIEIFASNDWYLETGEWDFDRVIERIHQKLRDALTRGHVGLRLNGSSAWLQRKGPDSFRIYESNLDDMVAGQPLIVLCTFPLDQTPATDLLDVGDSHLFVGAMRNGRCQVLETPELRMTREELTAVNNELVDAVRRGALRPFP